MLPVWHTCPTEELPLGTPFTNHESRASDVCETLAVKVARRPVPTVAVGGEIEIPTLPTSVTVAEAVCGLPDGGLKVAWIVSGFALGSALGAV